MSKMRAAQVTIPNGPFVGAIEKSGKKKTFSRDCGRRLASWRTPTRWCTALPQRGYLNTSSLPRRLRTNNNAWPCSE